MQTRFEPYGSSSAVLTILITSVSAPFNHSRIHLIAIRKIKNILGPPGGPPPGGLLIYGSRITLGHSEDELSDYLKDLHQERIKKEIFCRIFLKK